MNINTFKRLILANALLLAAGFTQQAHAADDTRLIKHGEYLARMADCYACHSAAGKPAFSGGNAIQSNLGPIYPSNITPDKQNGIGNYTEAQFANAVRKGVLPDGTHLYPAMPYPDYAKINNDDMHALYVFFMKGVKPVNVPSQKTSLSFPFSQRWAMRFWNSVFTEYKPFQPIKGATAQVNRGAYIVESLGHCGSCHTPRGVGMNEKALDSSQEQFLSGGSLNGWAVPSLRGLPHWTEQEVVAYLQTGRNDKAAVAGEMKSVVQESTSYLTDADLKAVAAYLKFLGGQPAPVAANPQAAKATEAKLAAAKNLTKGERLYLDNCAACHSVNAKGAQGIFPRLDQSTMVNANDPGAFIHVILAGAQLPSTAKAPSKLAMPGFGQRLNDQQVADLATFIRQGWSNTAPEVSKGQVADVRKTLKHP